MPDTGAPWNIPYVESADLVSDWPADSLLVANAVAAGLTAADNAGIGSNVVSVSKTDPFTSTATTFTNITGLSVSITPTSATVKVLLIAQVHFAPTATGALRFSGGNSTAFVPSSAGSRTAGMGAFRTATQWDPNLSPVPYTFVYLDSPATTSATTYNVQGKCISGTWYINRANDDTDANTRVRTTCSLTAIEVAA